MTDSKHYFNYLTNQVAAWGWNTNMEDAVPVEKLVFLVRKYNEVYNTVLTTYSCRAKYWEIDLSYQNKRHFL